MGVELEQPTWAPCGVDFCSTHHGIRNEDEEECDLADGLEVCVLHETFYRTNA